MAVGIGLKKAVFGNVGADGGTARGSGVGGCSVGGDCVVCEVMAPRGDAGDIGAELCCEAALSSNSTRPSS